MSRPLLSASGARLATTEAGAETRSGDFSLQLINMKGGGYTNFLNEIKTKAQTNCLAKFIIVDADRISSNAGEKSVFLALLDYCRLQNRKRTIPHFLIVNNPDFEYAACLHISDYKDQDTTAFITKQLGFKSVGQFKGNDEIYNYLNTAGSYQNLLDRIQDETKLVRNIYVVRKKSFDVKITDMVLNMDALAQRGTNLDEFFDVIDW